MIKGFLFDLDGVIVDTAVFHFQAWRKVAQKLGGDFTEAQNEQLKGISRTDSLKKIIEWTQAEVSVLQFQELQEQKNRWYLDLIGGLGPEDALPGAIEFLRRTYSQGILIALGSASKNAPMVLEKLGVTELFSAVIDGNNVINGKPHPEVFLKGAEALGLEPSECLVFEDSIAGVQAAKQGGMSSVGIGEAETLNANIHFESLGETTPELLAAQF
ncbi:MAG: beta-phosphoglucomutase [Flavobacteriales bacterium]|jgi:beta-phosphoglucomutase|nr:beta-phosphoglucomutase [Flavobacteriales bacterium]|tara:strand:+ start:9207 stop:9851 length:645 start_codon:yes stop_codon:yes gene_type:complete